MSNKSIFKRIIKHCIILMVIVSCFMGNHILGIDYMKVHASGADSRDIYSDTWVLKDALGRSAQTDGINKSQEKKYVGIFYHIWHKDFMSTTVSLDRKAPRSVSQIIRENENALDESNVWGPNVTYHYWAEPLFGYYDLSNDDYVIRKHAQMLTDAGIDAIIIDYSNYAADGTHSEAGYTKSTLKNLLKVFAQIQSEGGDTPGVVFLLTWNGEYNGPAIKRFYKDFYSKEEYKNLWFKWEGKPLILAQDTTVPDEIKDYFTYRKPHPFYTPVTEANTWPWLSIYPQEPAYTQTNSCEMVSVGIAQNWTDSLDFMSAQDENGNFTARGRSYTVGGDNVLSKSPISDEYKSEYGANLQQQFDRAIELDPNMILITGWNEWIAARFLDIPDWAASSKKDTPAFGGFCDVFTTEFSRDAEPTRECKLADNFYNQIVINIRRFKGAGENKNNAISKTIDIKGEFDQWDEITYEYRDDTGDISTRKAKSIGNRKTYVNETGRNDFKTLKVTYDLQNIYFYAETVSDITPYTDTDWMNLLLQVSSSNPNWEGYDYILNRSNVRESFTTLERSKGGYNWEIVSEDIQYRVSGNKMMLSIPFENIGIKDTSNFTIDFKWADNIQAETEKDAMAFYLNGDCAPNERFCYRFMCGTSGSDSEGNKNNNNKFKITPVITFAIAAACLAVLGLAGVIISTKIKKK